MVRRIRATHLWARSLLPDHKASALSVWQRCLVLSAFFPRQHEGKTIVLEVSESTTILDAALDNGIELPHDCKLGVCLTCPSKVVSGEVDQSDGTLDDSVVEQV